MKILINALVALFFLFAASACFAQTPDAERFRMLQSDHGLLLNNKVQYSGALAILTEKLNETSARASLLIYDSRPSLSIEIQPINFAKDGIVKDGESTVVKWRKSTNGSDVPYFSDQSVVFLIGQNTNAVMLRLFREGDDPDMNTRIVVPADFVSQLTTVRFRLPDSSSASNKDFDFTRISLIRCTETKSGEGLVCNCPLVELENSTCGHKCKYCGDFIGNIINGVSYSITCGSPCVSTQCEQLDCLGPDS